MNLFSYDSMFSRFLYFVADIVTLHFLWLIHSLPIVTIGASTTALYYSCMKRIRTGEGYVTRNFRKSFRENFRQSTIIWLILLVTAAVFFCDLRIAWRSAARWEALCLQAAPCFSFRYCFLRFTSSPCRRSLKTLCLRISKMPLIMSIRHFPCSLLLIAIYVTIFLLLFTFPPLAGLLPLLRSGADRLPDVQYFRIYFPEICTRRAGERPGSFRRTL